MATLTNTKVKDTYHTLLKLTSGSIGGGYTAVQDGEANDSGLSLSTSRVGVLGLTFINHPPTGSGMTTALFIENPSGDVYKQELAASAFTLPAIVAGNAISVTGGFPLFTVTNTAPDQTVTFTGTDISIGGAYPNFTLTNDAPDQTVSFTGTDISIGGVYPNFTLTNDAPDKVVSISGTGGANVTGTYPNFTVDTSSIVGVHEEMFVGVPESPYTLGSGIPQVISFSNPNNTTEETSYHFGNAPAKITRPSNDVIMNGSGKDFVVYIDIAAYIDVLSPNSDITYNLQSNTGTGWLTKQKALRTKGSAGLHVDSFWGIFIVADGEQLRIQVESDSGNVIVNPQTQVKFQVKETGNII